MPQAKRGASTSGSSSGGRSSSSGGRSSGSRARATGKSSSASGRSSSARSTGSRSGRSGKSGKSGTSTAGRSRPASASSSAGASDQRLEAVAQRLRRLNERIIEAGKDAGETTLTNYEKALKAIASAVERGPGRSDVDWISSLATAQAKFIRDVTTAWTNAARDMLK